MMITSREQEGRNNALRVWKMLIRMRDKRTKNTGEKGEGEQEM